MTDDEIIAAVRARFPEGESRGPASAEAVAEAEQVIGYRLPPLLRRLYLEVANGGFGPDDGVLGVPGGEWIGDWADIVDVYTAFSSGPEQRHPAWLVWLHDWGCALWSLVDCRDPAGPMWGWDPNGCCLDHGLYLQHMTLADWLTKSLDDSLEAPDWSENPDQIAHMRKLGHLLPPGPTR